MVAKTDSEDHADEAATVDPGRRPARRHRARPAARRSRHPLAVAVMVFGELLITAGLVLGLFVVYSLWWTNVVADETAHRQSRDIRHDWASHPKPGPVVYDGKDGIGFLHVPAMHNGEVLVKKGTSNEVLNDGVAGYYTRPVKSALPQDKTGNFSLAAHRDGHGAKFHNIDKVKKGDAIVFETKDTWYIYKTYAILKQTSKYDVKAIDPIPKESGRKQPGRYITLTTCTPVYTSLYRYVVWGELERTEKVDSQRTPPAELKQGS